MFAINLCITEKSFQDRDSQVSSVDDPQASSLVVEDKDLTNTKNSSTVPDERQSDGKKASPTTGSIISWMKKTTNITIVGGAGAFVIIALLMLAVCARKRYKMK